MRLASAINVVVVKNGRVITETALPEKEQTEKGVSFQILLFLLTAVRNEFSPYLDVERDVRRKREPRFHAAVWGIVVFVGMRAVVPLPEQIASRQTQIASCQYSKRKG